jgi:hypothetical protein
LPTVQGRKNDSEHMVSHCPAPVCKRYRTLGRKFLTPKDLHNVGGGRPNKPDSQYQPSLIH